MKTNEVNSLFRLKVSGKPSQETNTAFSQELFETATILIRAQREIILNRPIPFMKVLKKSQK